MQNITIKSKSYFPITTLVEGRTIKIPAKGKELKITASKISEHMKELEAKNLIQIVVR